MRAPAVIPAAESVHPGGGGRRLAVRSRGPPPLPAARRWRRAPRGGAGGMPSSPGSPPLAIGGVTARCAAPRLCAAASGAPGKRPRSGVCSARVNECGTQCEMLFALSVCCYGKVPAVCAAEVVVG